MRKNIYQKYKAAMCFIIAMQLAAACIAGDLEDAIKQISGKANVVDVANSNEGDIEKQAIEIKPQNENNIDTQLKQIEENYKSQIDACTNQQNHDELSSNLAGLNGINNKGLQTNDIKDLIDKNAPNRKKIKISKNDELLITAQSIDKATIDEATNTVIFPEASTKHTKRVEDRILTCHEAGDEVVKKCYRSRIVKAKQPENIKFIVEVYFSAQSYAGHDTSVDLKTGAISYHNSNANHPSSKVVNSFSTYAPNAEIISIRHIESRWWHEAGVHTESVHSQITQPSKENDYVYKNSIEQGAMGRKKMKRRNGDKYRGRVEKWEVTAKPAPVLEEHWDNGECDQLANYAQTSFCEGPVINLIAVGETRTIENYPHPVTRTHWQEEHIYACGGGSIANECLTLHNAGCTQIDSKCISAKGPFCVEYLQTLNCGKNRIISNLTTRGNKVTIDSADNE